MLIIQVYVNYSSFRRSSICWMGDAGRTVYRRTVDVLMPVFFSPITTNYSANEHQPPLVLPRRGDAGYSVCRRTIDVLVYQSLPYGGRLGGG